MKKFFLLLSFMTGLLANNCVNAQQQELYTFCTGGSYCYLIDTAGSASNYYARWNTGVTPYTAHFQKDTIYQSAGTGGAGGSYGSVKKWACTGTTTATCVWTYTTSNMHHDLCPLPNGNVLIIVSETKTASQIAAAGGSFSGTVTVDNIREIHPTGTNTGTVVWEWKLWDHLCQTTSSSYPNYVTSVAQNPQLFNINCGMSSDWFHTNGIDYNPTLDQIVISSHFKNEIFVIDHSTTTAEAASHSGGKAGKGGDFLYRWGNPANYGCAAGGNGVTLNAIHDVRWVSATNAKYPDYISIFHNNGGTNAEAILFLPPHDGYNYTYTPGSVIGPASCLKPVVPAGINSGSQGGLQALENGNIIITQPGSKYYECSGTGTTYQTVSVTTVQADRLKKCEVLGPFPKASASEDTVCLNAAVTLNSSAISPMLGSSVYTYAWSSIPAGFTSTMQNPVVTPTEAGIYTYEVTITNNDIGCSAKATVSIAVDSCFSNIETAEAEIIISVFPNPTTGIINILTDETEIQNYEISVFDTYGKLIFQEADQARIDLSGFSNGLYYLMVKTDKGIIREKIILSR